MKKLLSCFTITLCALLLALVTFSAQAQIRIYVKKGATGSGTSWENAVGEISTALSMIPNPNYDNAYEIWVAKGTYHPGNYMNAQLILRSNVHLYGGFAGNESFINDRDITQNETIISGDFTNDQSASSANLIYGYRLSAVTVDGFTISGANTYNTSGSTSSAIQLYETYYATLRNLTIENNFSYGNGGGIMIQEGLVTIDNTIIRNNQTTGSYSGSGGGIYCYGADLIVRDVKLQNNRAHNGEGGGIRFQPTDETGSLSMKYTIIENNYASSQGGGFYLAYGKYANQIDTEDLIIRNNEAGVAGGGFASRYAYARYMKGVLIENNKAPIGGGVYLDAPRSGSMYTAKIRNNTATNKGGGVYLKIENNYTNNEGFSFYSSMISRNSAINGGSEIYYENALNNASNKLGLINCLVESATTGTNHILQEGGSNNTIEIQNTIVAGTARIATTTPYNAKASIINGDLSIANGNIPSTFLNFPIFKSRNPADSTFYYPVTGSLLQDAGHGYTHWISLDLANKDRYYGPQLDIGPYEIQEPSPLQAPFRLYVKKGATGSGSSWDNPLGELSEALAIAASHASRFTESNPLRIFVAKGTYTPAYTANNFTAGGVRNTFLIPKNVQIHGGFDPDNGVKSLEHPRTVADYEATILSGDINNNDTRTGRTTTLALNNYSDNAIHVVTILDELGAGLLQGVKIVGGNATSTYGSQTINDHVIRDTDGAAIWMSPSSTPITFNNVYFEHNTYANSVIHAARPLIINNSKFRLNNGANNAILQTALPITVRNTLIEGNYTTSKRDFYLSGSSSTAPSIFENLTVVDNGYWGTSATFSFIEASHYAAIQVRNSVFYPMAANSQQTYNFFNTYGAFVSRSISNSIVQRWNNTTDGNLNGNSYNVTTLFKNPTQLDYRPANGSALINGGLNSNYTGDSKDLSENVRVNGTIEIGAYEWSESPVITNLAGDVISTLAGATTLSAIDANQDATLTDNDTPLYNGGQLIITTTNGTLSDHFFSIITDWETTLVDHILSYADQQIGTVLGIGTNKLVIHFKANATNVAVNEILKRIGYRNTNADLNTTRFTIQTKLLDGAGGESSYTSYVDVIRSSITITNQPTSVDYFIDSQLVLPIAPQITANIPSHASITAATISINYNLDSSTDVLALSGTHNINAHFNSSSGVLSLTGTGTASEWQEALRSVTYKSSVATLPALTEKMLFITLTTDLAGSKTSTPIPIFLRHSTVVGPNDKNIIYVNKSNQNTIRNGRNWENALTELADALKWVYDNQSVITEENPVKIFVTKGVYHPLDRQVTNQIMEPPYFVTTLTRSNNNRENSFFIPANVEIYGGFDPANGINTLADERILMDDINGTILSGDYLNNDIVSGSASTLMITNNTENAKQIIGIATSAKAKLSGLTIKSAFATDYETGGAINATINATLELENLIISNNRCFSGSAIVHYGGIANATNLLIKNNIVHENFSIVNLTRFVGNTYGESVWNQVEITGNSTRYLHSSQYSNSTAGTLLMKNFDLKLVNSKIHNNVASTPSSYVTSGTVHITDSQLKVINTLLYSNVGYSLFYGANANLSLVNSTVINNGMTQFWGSGNIVARNSIVIRHNGNATNSVFPINITDAKNSLIQGMGASAENKVLDGTVAGLFNLFNNATSGDFSLLDDAASNGRTLASNPLINAGNIAYYDVATMGRYDLAGNERVRDGAIDLGPYELQRGDTPLPVSLVRLQATLENQTAVLNWQTTEEVNFSHFEVEYSSDGKLFEAIGTVDSNTQQLYSFTTPINGTVTYFRLKMIDLDGSYSYSKLVSVESNSKNDFIAYPNPILAQQTITVSTAVAGKATLLDMTGRTLAIYTLTKGTQSITLPQLQPGIYIFTNAIGKTVQLVVKE